MTKLHYVHLPKLIKDIWHAVNSNYKGQTRSNQSTKGHDRSNPKYRGHKVKLQHTIHTASHNTESHTVLKKEKKVAQNKIKATPT